MKRFNPTFVILIVALLLSAVLPMFASSYVINIMIMILSLAYVSSVWNLIGGVAGQGSFGHAMFFGIGAYTTTLLLLNHNISPLLSMAVAMILSGILGAIIGLVTFRFRLKHLYFAIVTLSLGEIVNYIAQGWKDFTGGVSGILINVEYAEKYGASYLFFSGNRGYYYMILIMVVLVLWFFNWVRKRKIGYYWAAIGVNEDAAMASGVDTYRYKIFAMVITAMLMAPAGVFYAQYTRFIDPYTVLGLEKSFEMLLPVIIGGAGTLFGPFLGSVLLISIRELVTVIAGQNIVGLSMIIYGMILLVFIMFVPGGLSRVLGSWKRAAARQLQNRIEPNRRKE